MGPVRVLALGGVGEIGKNMYVVEMDGRMVVIDCGVSFPKQEQLGVDLVLPDFSYVRERRDSLVAVLLTHGHEDHIGALPYLLREVGSVPVYGTRFTLGLVKSKLDEHRLLKDAALVEVEPGVPETIGPFTAEFVRVSHSIPDPVAIALHTPHGTIVHSGDFKFDQAPIDNRPTDVAALARLGDGGVLLLLADSTGAETPGTIPSERSVGKELQKVMATAPGRVIITTFASHVHRVQQALEAAYADGRSVAVVGRSLKRNTNIAQNLGYLEPPEGTLVRVQDLDLLPVDEQVILSTGSQGEPLSALRRMAHAEHPQVTVRPGDTVIFSARAVPGNELAVNETINRLVQAGARVVTRESAAVHVSGHGGADELLLMLRLLRPRFLMPIHGEPRHLRAHADLARSVGMAGSDIFTLENGDVLEVANVAGGPQAAVVERIEAGITFVDGLGVGDVVEGVLRDRRHLSEDGLVLLVATVSARDGTPVGGAEVITRGFGGGEEQQLIEETRLEVERSLLASAADQVTGIDMLQHQLHDAVAALLYRKTRQRPMILPVVVEV
ncbi:MAG: ribonuclease [Miltoncostaeaceae bacterium]|nr:ribonuclease [Miltoncostaeaceae bacterium]